MQFNMTETELVMVAMDLLEQLWYIEHLNLETKFVDLRSEPENVEINLSVWSALEIAENGFTKVHSLKG
jgi:hypothetical protein